MKLVKALKTTLNAPLSASGTSIVLKKFVDLDGTELAMSDFGDWGVIVIKQGDTVEMIKFDALSQSGSDTTCTLTVATSGRSIAGTSPYAGASTGNDFNAGAEVIVSNDPLTLSRFGNLDVAATWNTIQTFGVLPRTTAGNPIDANDLARKAYVDSVVAGIASTVNLIVSGIAGETLAAGNLVYLKAADGRWWKCDADTASTVENVNLGIAQGAGTAGGAITGGVLTQGLDANQSGLTASTKYYASNTAGGISTSAGTKEVTIGFSHPTDVTKLYFQPRFDQSITEDEQDALGGSSGTPSATNKFITAGDVSDTAVSGKIVRATGTALPALDGSNLTGVVIRNCGDGSDGDVVISGTTTLTRHMYYNNLTITGTLISAGYMVFVKGTVDGAGTLKFVSAPNNGGNGGNGSGGTGGTAGTAGAAQGNYFVSTAGSAGGAGGNSANDGAAGATINVTSALGSAGVAGGNAGASYSGDTTSGGGAGTVTAPSLRRGIISAFSLLGLDLTLGGALAIFKSSAGSGSGAGGSGEAATGTASGGGGGGSGETGGLIMLVAKTWAGTFTISNIGGNGGNGGNGAHSDTTGGSGGGGGSGGSGGTNLVFYGTKTWTGSHTLTGGTGGSGGTGAGGTGGGNGVAGSSGNAGVSIEIAMSGLTV